MGQPQHQYSLDDYFNVEESSPLKHEFYRGEKFALYRSIASLREYVTIQRGAIEIEHHRRSRDGSWRSRRITRRGSSLKLATVDLSLPVEEIYLEVL